MKAFFSRLHLGSGNTKDKDVSAQQQKEKINVGPLPSWPPPPERATTTPTSVASYKPLPELNTSPRDSDRPLPPIQLQQPQLSQSSTNTSVSNVTSNTPSTPVTGDKDIALDLISNRAASPRYEQDEVTRGPRKVVASPIQPTSSGTNGVPGGEVPKKVAFKSPPPTPGSVTSIDRIPPEASSAAPTSSSSSAVKSTVSRFHATHGKEPRGSTSSGASSSKTDLGSTSKTSGTTKATSTRATSPYMQRAADVGSAQSLRSGTPYSQMSAQTSGSRILSATSWSEVTEEDLVSNLGSRERTRQEVLFEIISSEERYVLELVKMKETFIDPLLHPYSSATATPVSSSPNLDYEYYPRTESPVGSTDYLPPIAARFMSPSPGAASPGPAPSTKSTTTKDTPYIDGESLDTEEEEEGQDHIGRAYPSRRTGNASQVSKHNHPRSPYRGATSKPTRSGPVPFPSRSHQSLPPPPRNNQMNDSTHSLGRQSVVLAEDRRERNNSYGHATATDRKQSTSPQKSAGMLRKFKKSQTGAGTVLGDAIAPHQLPDDLRICLEVIDSGVFDGHKRLHEALKKRYDEQYPLVRSLADVFVSNSDIFNGYATYVIHLERALDQVNDALSNEAAKKPPKKSQDPGEYVKVCKVLQRLEGDAFEKGETGLAITLSKPFQRLLKYPLLFQNLLFHTDPSTYEYESTLQMVAEVETIVRSIEDEKIQKEDRDKTRDVFARIEGLDKVRQLALPKPSRVLLEERLYLPALGSLSGQSKPGSSTPPPVANAKNVRGKSSFKRLSDVLSSNNGVGGKKDLWLVVFNDVVLQCQRTGTTSLPLVAATNSRTNSLPELQGKTKYATTGRRNQHTTPRNLYKFLKIETWDIGQVVKPREGLVSMEDVARTRSHIHTSQQPRIVPMPDDDDDDERAIDSDDSDRKSKMSFSYWGADKVTVQKPVIKAKAGVSAPRRGGAISPSYGRESSANAKFGHRLVSNESSPNPRPASRRTQASTPTGRSRTTDDSAKATVTRPAWDSNPRSQTTAPARQRSRNTSQTAGTLKGANASTKSLNSPAPSEDSGVGLYRQMLAKDPSLNQ